MPMDENSVKPQETIHFIFMLVVIARLSDGRTARVPLTVSMAFDKEPYMVDKATVKNALIEMTKDFGIDFNYESVQRLTIEEFETLTGQKFVNLESSEKVKS